MLLTVRVHPRASRTRAGWKGDVLEVWVTAPPVAGAANEAVLGAVARELGVAEGAVRLRSGARGRTKVVEIDDGARTKAVAEAPSRKARDGRGRAPSR